MAKASEKCGTSEERSTTFLPGSAGPKRENPLRNAVAGVPTITDDERPLICRRDQTFSNRKQVGRNAAKWLLQVVKGLSANIAMKSPPPAPGAGYDFRDDEEVPVICPTCQAGNLVVR